MLRAILVFVALALPALPARAGYSHDWIWKAEPDRAQVDACLVEMRAIVAASGDIVTTDIPGCGEGAGAHPGELCFNGIGDDAHEDFVFPGTTGDTDPPDPMLKGWNSCKTMFSSAKPYDEVVTACLIVARDHFPPETLEILSDGTWADWADGAALYERVLQRTARDPTTPGEALTLGDEDEPAARDGGDPTSSRGGPALLLVLLLGAAAIVVWSRRRPAAPSAPAVAPAPKVLPFFGSFDDSARRLLFFARHEALQHRHAAIEPLHMLAGALVQPGERLARLLTSQGVSVEPVLADLRARLAAFPASAREGASPEEIALSASTKHVLKRCVGRQPPLGERISDLHVVLALLELGRSDGAALDPALADLRLGSISPADVEAAIHQP